MKHKVIQLIPTPINLRVIIHCFENDEINWFANKYGKDYEEAITWFTNPCVGKLHNYDNNETEIVMLISKGELRPEIITHESVHALFTLANIIGWDIRPTSQEVFAYWQEYIVVEILDNKNWNIVHE